ncbi:uncharacterized protein CELE_F31E3.12 [Caenorhabditis elegans]|uniref:Uncharacterized protein n=1 Tax=Caenorhabditis elegans TaxID=6239 RepID=H1ZUV9_CAEEL|nr:Uncharacterized protein CELE_F31E3.12 [Caenorhabditis elegans]CCF23340.1 Uncharacterized protein CELE_F31E3.12 [Caenorhabditis elegans]|eukprot:NP_001254943.1 Uncharacterized protein CELE_F31E3.12 [Caenorhabditis elegans]
MTQKLSENEEKDDTGYYTPKNILNPAMFRLAEITRALSEVNMEVEKEKLFDDRRHTINVDQFTREEIDINERNNESPDAIEILDRRSEKQHCKWTTKLKNNEDTIAKVLIICLIISITLLMLMLIFWS